jgi:hypothetical protein
MRTLCSSLLGILIVTLALMLPALGAGAVSKRQLESEALSVSNFPTGWSVVNGEDIGDQGCVSGLRNPGKHVTKVLARFEDGNAPDVEEVLLAGSGAVHTYTKLIQALNKCTTYTAKSGGQTATVHVGAMSFPQVGQSSSAYAFTLAVQGINLGADLVLFRVGQTFGAVEYEDIGTPDAGQAQAFITEAVNKVEGKPAVTPTTF